MALARSRAGFVAWEIAAAVPYLLAVRAVVRQPRGDRLRWLAVAAALHGVLLFARVPLSDDLFRYRWDARVARAGIDPYAFAPDAPQLRHLRDPDHRRINHPEVRTIYPPGAQALFRAVTAVWDDPFAFRLVAAVASLLASLALAGFLRARGADDRLAIVLCWSPLAAAEASVGAHIDAAAVALLVAGLWALAARRAAAAGALLGLSFAIKLGAGPIALLAARRRPIVLAAFALAVAAPLLPHLGGPVMPGASDYADRWRFNPSIFAAVEAAVDFAAAVSATPAERRFAARVAAAAAWLALLAWLLARRVDAADGARALVGAALLLSPTVHPWYALWLLPLLAERPTPGWLALASLLPLSYLGESGGIRLVEYGVPFVIAVASMARRGRPRLTERLTDRGSSL